MPELALIRGLPGSGKSTIARGMDGFEHIETDQYFTDSAGVYTYKPSAAPEAHQWCLQTAAAALRAGRSVVVSNTFTTRAELQPFLELAAALGITPRIIEARGRWQNVHGVPAESYARMADRWEAIPTTDGPPIDPTALRREIIDLIIQGASLANLEEYLQYQHPTIAPAQALNAAADYFANIARESHTTKLGWGIEAARDVYARAVKIGDLSAALRAIKLACDLSQQADKHLANPLDHARPARRAADPAIDGEFSADPADYE